MYQLKWNDRVMNCVCTGEVNRFDKETISVGGAQTQVSSSSQLRDKRYSGGQA